jgi:hypothetical protein
MVFATDDGVMEAPEPIDQPAVVCELLRECGGRIRAERAGAVAS